MNVVPAVAYHFCLNLPAAITQPGAHLLAERSIAMSFVTFTDSIVVAQHGALLDDAEVLEHGAHLVLAVLLRHHPNKQFSL